MKKKAHHNGTRFLAPEYAFVAIGLVFGLLLIYANPPFHGNDEDRHFNTSYLISTGQIAPRQEGGQVGGFLPTSVMNIGLAYQVIPYANGAKISKAQVEKMASAPLPPADNTLYKPPYLVNPVPFVPFVVGIWVTKLVDSSPISLLRGARFAGLVSYLAIVFLAVRMIPIHKYVLVAVALSPMPLFQASSVTYDTLCLAIAFLIVAMVLKFAMRESEVSNRELLALVVLTILLRSTKSGYFLVPFFFFVVPQKNIGTKWKSIGIFSCLVGACLVPALTWDAFVSSLHLHGAQVFQNDFYFDISTQLAFYKTRLVELFQYLVLNVLFQGKRWIIGAIGRFGYSYVTLPEWVAFVHGLALIAISILDTSPPRRLLAHQKAIAFCVSAGTVAVIVGGAMLLLTPVGARVIFGVQGRYFLPILPVLLLLNFNSEIRSRFWEKWKALLVPGYAVLVLGYTVSFINGFFWVP